MRKRSIQADSAEVNSIVTSSYLFSDVDDEKKKDGIFSSICNWTQTLIILVNSSVGSGILTYPYSYMSCGFITGFLMTILIGFLASTTMIFCEIGLVYAKNRGKRIGSYQELIGYYCGPIIRKIVEIICVFYFAGGCISYLTVMGDSVQPIVQYYTPDWFFICDRKVIIIILASVILFPMTLIREIGGLSSVSSLSNIGVFCLVILVVCYFFVTIVILTPPSEFQVNSDIFFSTKLFDGILPTFLISLPLISFSFQSHVSIAPLYDSLQVKNLCWISSLSTVGFVVVGFIYLCVGVAGYFQFEGIVDADFLMSYDANGIVGSILRILIGVVVSLTYPIKFFMDRLAFETLLFDHNGIRDWFYDVKHARSRKKKKNKGRRTHQSLLENATANSVTSSWSTQLEHKKEPVILEKSLKTCPFLTLTLGLFISTLIITLYVPDIVSVVGIVGSFGSTTLMFVFPNLMMISLIWGCKTPKKLRSFSFIMKFGLYVFFALFAVFGFLVCFFGIFSTILKITSTST